MRVHVDPERCRGHARCLTIAPDVFDFLDLEDRAVVREGAVSGADPAVLREAERECPEQAISVELDTEAQGNDDEH
ncbi:ferredoxin [Mycolicibacter senuensis]|uniref:ferredoxin n=1 Tax=Mycolicibacter senuensis TaxID=386913 RepID=UPI000DCB89FB|nr:ferredoxin [Mycolicibacter senuensis]